VCSSEQPPGSVERPREREPEPHPPLRQQRLLALESVARSRVYLG
jgi:hypothetical protein